MDLNELPGGIPSRVSGLLFALLRHLLALTELAAEEPRLLIRQSLVSILLLVALIVVVVIAYLSLLATLVSILTMGGGWGWPAAFGLVTLLHFVLAGVIFFFLRVRTKPRPYAETASEIRRDLDSLDNYSKKSSGTSASSPQ